MFEILIPAVAGFVGGFVSSVLLARWANRRRYASTCSECGAHLSYTIREINGSGRLGLPVCIECAVSKGIAKSLREDFN
jgi:hypothetical protein